MSNLKSPNPASILKDLADLVTALGGHGSYTVVTADDTAGTLDIDTGNTAFDRCMVQIYRAGVLIFSDQSVSISAGVITVADGSTTYALTAGDVIVYWAFDS